MSRRAIGWAAVLAQFALIGAILLAAGATPRSPSWLWWVGTGCLVAGLALLVVAAWHLGRSLTPTPVPNGAGLRTDGLYRWVRHPIYSGLLLACGGVVLHSFGPWTVLGWAALAALLWTKAAWEERMLTQVFAQYPEYAARTGRFVPRPGRRLP